MKSYVGVDIGSTAVRAVNVKGLDDEGFAVISRFGVVPLRGDAVQAGHIRDQQIVAQAVARAVKIAGGKSGAVVFGAMQPELAVARLALPAAVERHERVKAIKAMNTQVSPAIPVQEAALATNFVREETTGDNRKLAALVVAATPESEVETLLTVAKLAGVEPRAVDAGGAGLLRSLVRDVPASRDTATIVDVGATSTRVVTREGLWVRSIRSFPAGGLDLTRAIAQASGDSFEEAERRKYSMRLPTGMAGMPVDLNPSYAGLGLEDEEDEYQEQLAKQTALEQALATAAENLVDQIAQAVELDASNQGVMTRHLALCGGTALMRGLKERLQRRLGVQVRIGHPWARLEHNKYHQQHFHNGREDPRLMLSLATATGLALWSEQP